MTRKYCVAMLLPWLFGMCLVAVDAVAAPSGSDSQIPTPAHARVGVVFSRLDEFFLGEDRLTYEEIIAGIRGIPGVEVLQLALEGDAPFALAQQRGFVGVKLALNDAEGPIGVVFPDIGEPYRSVFVQIMEGIEAKTRKRVVSIPVGNASSQRDVATELRKQDVRVVIALGRNGLNATAGLDREISVVAGALLGAPEGDGRPMTVFSLAPDPALLFARLKALAPGVRRVFVVFDPRQNAWLIRLARDAARVAGIELVTTEVADIKAALGAYQEIMGNIDPRRDAIWLPQDSVAVDDSAVLPFLIQESWNRSFALFSSSLVHVRRGALFSLYPNNVELGRNLAGAALGIAGGAGARGVMPLREVLMALNIRTANHLGLTVNRNQTPIDMVFPSP